MRVFIIISGLAFGLLLLGSVVGMQESFAGFIPSPRQQLADGIAHEDIQCRENRVLVIRDNNFPACVTEKTAEKKGWKIIQTEFKINSTNENTILYDEDIVISDVDSETSEEIIIKTVPGESRLIESVSQKEESKKEFSKNIIKDSISETANIVEEIPELLNLDDATALTINPETEPNEIIVLLDREKVFYGHDGINLVAAFPIGTDLRYDVIDSNNEHVWPYHTLRAVHYSHVPIGFDKGTASIGTHHLEAGEYTIVVSTLNSIKTNEIKKSFTILDSKCCNPIDIDAQSDVFIPGDEFQIFVKTTPQTPLTINLIEPNGKIAQTKQITTNENGGINWQTLALSRIAIPGIWTLEAKSNTNSDSISLLVVPTPDELIKKSPTSEKIWTSYEEKLANKKSGYDVLLASSLEPFEDDGRQYRHKILEHYPAPTLYYDMIKYGWIDTTGFETDEYGIVTYVDEPHEKYSLNSKKGFYLEDWIPDNIPNGQKLLYAQTNYSTYEKNELINENYGASYNFVPINFVVDENTTTYDLKHSMGFRVIIHYNSWQDEIEDILEGQKERHTELMGNYGGYQTMMRDGEMMILFEGGYTGRHYENSIYWVFDDNYSIRVSSHYYTLDELLTIFDSIMKERK